MTIEAKVITTDDVFKAFYAAQLKEGRPYLIPSFAKFNDVCRHKLGIDPVAYTQDLATKGLVKISPKRSKNATPYVAITLTDSGYAHFGLVRLEKPKVSVTVNKTLDTIMADISAGKPITILRKVAKK